LIREQAIDQDASYVSGIKRWIKKYHNNTTIIITIISIIIMIIITINFIVKVLVEEEDVMSEMDIEREKECVLYGRSHVLKYQGKRDDFMIKLVM